MSKELTSQQLNELLDLFDSELNAGKSLTSLPMKSVDWNSVAGKTFLKKRCGNKNGKGEEIIRHFTMLRLKDENAIEILCAAIQNGVPIDGAPAELTFRGGEEKCKKLWDKIVENKRGKEYLELLRSFRGGDADKKLKAYDYVVSGYKRKGFDALPESKVIFGKFEEEDQEDRQREKVRKEQQLIEDQQLAEEQRRKAMERHRRSILTPVKMKSLTKKLKENGIPAIKELWRADALGALHYYIDLDDVKDFPEFVEALKTVIDSAVNKGFEETFRCVRAFPLIYGGQVRYEVPPVIKKAFYKYPAMLKAIEREFADQLDPREKRDYFFYTKLAVANPQFDWSSINFEMLPEDGVDIYDDNDAKIVLSLREQMEDIVITAYETCVRESVPEEYAYYHYETDGVFEVLWHRKNRHGKVWQKAAANNAVTTGTTETAPVETAAPVPTVATETAETAETTATQTADAIKRENRGNGILAFIKLIFNALIRLIFRS